MKINYERVKDFPDEMGSYFAFPYLVDVSKEHLLESLSDFIVKSGANLFRVDVNFSVVRDADQFATSVIMHAVIEIPDKE